ncbi:MAG: hypothetical protein JWQ27_2578 [Ferruginibacter sp.]|nr:hypothetical protein [Ferruginibacter sp.]
MWREAAKKMCLFILTLFSFPGNKKAAPEFRKRFRVNYKLEAKR